MNSMNEFKILYARNNILIYIFVAHVVRQRRPMVSFTMFAKPFSLVSYVSTIFMRIGVQIVDKHSPL